MSRLPEKGQTLWGFTVTERNSISMLGAETAVCSAYHQAAVAGVFMI